MAECVAMIFVNVALLAFGLLRLSRDPLSPLALYSYLAALPFVLRPVLLVFGLDDFFIPGLVRGDPYPLMAKAMFLFAVSHLAVMLAYWLGGELSRKFSRIISLSAPLSEARIVVVALVLAGISLVVMASGAASSEGTGVMNVQARLGSGFFAALPQFAAVFAGVLVLACWVARRRVALLFASAGWLVTIAANVYSGDRSGILFPFLILTAVFHLSVRRVPLKWLAMSVVVVMAASSSLNQLRSALLSDRGETNGPSLAALYVKHERSFPRKITEATNCQAFDYFAVTLQDMDYGSFRDGEDFLNGLVGVVPRALWKNKPKAITSGQWFRARYTPLGKAGRPFTTQGVYWVNFGYLGVIAGFLLCGLVLRWIWEFQERNKSVLATAFGVVMLLFVVSTGISSLVLIHAVKWVVPFLGLSYFLQISGAVVPETATQGAE